MTDMVWTTQPHGDLEARGHAGDWSISPYDVARISYVPALPGTGGINSTDDASREIYAKAFEETRSHPGREERTEEFQRLMHHFGPGLMNGMFAETVDEARMLVSALEAGAEGLAPGEEQLAAAGFVRPHPEHPTLHTLWSKRVRSGSLQVSFSDVPGKRSVMVRFHGDGARSWHNVAHVCIEQTGQSGTCIHHASPVPGSDALGITVAHIVRIMELRTARGGRFSKPLGEVLKVH